LEPGIEATACARELLYVYVCWREKKPHPLAMVFNCVYKLASRCSSTWMAINHGSHLSHWSSCQRQNSIN